MRDIPRKRSVREVDPVESLREDLAALREDIASLASNGVHRAGDYTRETLNSAAQGVQDVSDAARRKAEEAQEKISEIASERPLTTVAIVLVAGVLIGKVMGWMSRR